MITVELHRTVKGFSLAQRTVTAIVRGVCRGERIVEGRFSVVIVGDRAIQKIHQSYLRRNTVTDIITFSLESDRIDAEIYINAAEARRQARLHGVSVSNEFRRLVVHGVLHAAGYDDTTPRKRKRMFDVQERYVRELIPTY